MKFKRQTLFLAIILVALLGAFSVSTTLANDVEESQRSQFQTPILVVNTSFLNVRTGPGAQYTVLITVSGGTELPVLGIANDEVWYLVSTAAGVGWVNIEFLIPRGDFSNVPLVDTSGIFEEASNAAAAQAAAEALDATDNNRSNDTSSTGTTGNTSNTQTTRRTDSREWGVSVVEPHFARSQPTINSNSPGTAVANMDIIFTIIDAVNAEGITWYLIEDSFLGPIWIESTKSVQRPFGCGPISVVVMAQPVQPGEGPDGSGSLNREITLPTGAEAYLLDAVQNQYRIELIDGSDGWIPATDAAIRDDDEIFIPFCTSGATFTTTAPNDTSSEARFDPNTTETDPDTTVRTNRPRFVTSPRAIVNTSFLNIRSGPGAQFTVVTTVRGGTELDVLGLAPDEVWYLVEGSFGTGWLNSEFVIFRGDGSFLPIVEVTGAASLDVPVIDIFNAVTLFAAPDITLGILGSLSGIQTDITIVARTADLEWVQIDTNIGFGWVLADQVVIRGDLSLVPIVSG